MDLWGIKHGRLEWPINVECPLCHSMRMEGPYSGDGLGHVWDCLNCKCEIYWEDFEEAENA